MLEVATLVRISECCTWKFIHCCCQEVAVAVHSFLMWQSLVLYPAVKDLPKTGTIWIIQYQANGLTGAASNFRSMNSLPMRISYNSDAHKIIYRAQPFCSAFAASQSVATMQ